MPNNVYVWIVAILALGVVVALAMRLGRGFRVKKGADGYSLEVDKAQVLDTRTDNIKVGAGIELKDVEAGDMAGRKGTGGGAGDRAQNIEVGDHAKIERSKLGDIVGIKEEGSSPPPPEKKP
jgi:hypothetical protein